MAFEGTIRRNDGVVVVDLSGEVDGAADDALNACYQEAIADNPTTVLLNFDNVAYINSTGIALIVGLLAEARGSSRSILACGLTEHYKEIFEITRIADFMTIFPDEQGAITSVAATS
jgi:anti-sigma B factor antagonist